MLIIVAVATVDVLGVFEDTLGVLAIPIMWVFFGIDPAVVSAPLITTLVDATGLIIHFLFARASLGYG